MKPCPKCRTLGARGQYRYINLSRCAVDLSLAMQIRVMRILTGLTDHIAPKESRAEVFSGFQLGLYIGATVPAVFVGFAAKVVSFGVATLAFVAIIAALAVMGLAWIRLNPATDLKA